MRPAFLSVTVAGCLLGFSGARLAGATLDWIKILSAPVLAGLAHAAINLFNDYYDHLNGSDVANTERIYPFTGGSRFIQNRILTAKQVLAYALTLVSVVVAGGLWLIDLCGGGLFWIGLLGMLIGWAYSAPPLKLNSRGLGEVCVTAGFLLIVTGSDYVLRGRFDLFPWLAGLPYALLVTNVLYINQFPDREADRLAGKRHWVVRLPPRVAAYGYALILGLAVIVHVALAALGILPKMTLWALVGMITAPAAAQQLILWADTPVRLRPAIVKTLVAAHAYPLILAAFLWIDIT